MELRRSQTMGALDCRRKDEKSERNVELRKLMRRAKREAEKAIKVIILEKISLDPIFILK